VLIFYHCTIFCQDSNGEIYYISEEEELRDRLHFIKFETKYIESCVDFIRQNIVGSAEISKDKFIKVTGGGAYKYKNLLSSKLGVQYVCLSLLC